MANLRIDQVVKSYLDNTVVHGVSCDIAAGEFIVIVGPSGCGKSTLLRMIAGLEPVSAGRIWMDGRDVTNHAAADRGIAMVFQSYALYPHMTVRDNMSFALRNLRRSAQEIEQKVAAAAQLLRLEELLDRLPSQLSGGQRQRVAIGRAIVREPQIFLFDEPLSNLDAELRMQMRRELGKLHQRLGSTMVYVTHDQTEAMTLADRILLLNKGRIVQFGTPLELYNEPSDLFAAGFIGSPRINLIAGEIREAGDDQVAIGSALGARWLLARARLGGLALPAPVTLGIRPEHWHLERARGDLEVSVTVSMVETLGDCLVAYATLDDGSEVVVKLAGQGALAAGERTRLHLALGDVLLFDQAGRRIALQPG